MLENDYIMRMILLYVKFLRQALEQKHGNPKQVALDLEQSIGEAVSIDHQLLFSLAPESMVTMLQLGGFDEVLAGYMIRAMALDAEYLRLAGDNKLAELRWSQINGLISSFGLLLNEEELSFDAIEDFMAQHDEIIDE
jgi:hypothetical protein